MWRRLRCADRCEVDRERAHEGALRVEPEKRLGGRVALSDGLRGSTNPCGVARMVTIGHSSEAVSRQSMHGTELILVGGGEHARAVADAASTTPSEAVEL